MFHDVVVNLIVVLLIVAMAVVWHETRRARSPISTRTGQNGWLGALYEDKANPAVAVDRAAAGVVLPVPVRAAAHLQGAVAADLRHDHHPDHPDGAADRLAVPRHAAATAGCRGGPSGVALGLATPAVLIALTIAGNEAPGARRRRHHRQARVRQPARRRPLIADAGCTTCHNFGAGGCATALARAWPRAPPKLADDVDAIEAADRRNGGGGMPPFKGALTDDADHSRSPSGIAGLSHRHAARPAVGSRRMRVMLGITGASGAPYAARVLRALADAGAEVGVCASRAGRQVIALEIYGDRRDGRHATRSSGSSPTTAAPDMRIWEERDYSAPYASGSARARMRWSSAPARWRRSGTIVAGAEANLIHRAAGVQLKERRKLVLVPRETPLSSIHLENLLTLRNAGADVVAAMPGFYHLPQTIDDLVDFVAGRVIDSLGLDMTLFERWGCEPGRCAAARAGARDVRPHLAFVRPHEPADERGHGRPLARRGPCAPRGLAPGDAALDVCCGTGDLAIELRRAVGPGRPGGRSRLLRADARGRPPQERPGGVGAGRRAGAALRRRRVRRRHGRLGRAQPGRPRARLSRDGAGRAAGRPGRLPGDEHAARLGGTVRPALDRPRRCRCWAARSPATPTPTRYLPESVHRFPDAPELAAVMRDGRARAGRLPAADAGGRRHPRGDGAWP